MSYIDGMLAAVRLRMGDLDRARADLEQAERVQSERSARLNETARAAGPGARRTAVATGRETAAAASRREGPPAR